MQMKGDDRGAMQFRHRRQVLRATAAALLSFGSGLKAQTPGKPLPVGGLPVTCNLTLPVACMASTSDPAAAKGTPLFEFSKYSGWPEIKESLMSGRIKAAYMLAPLIMDLADSAIPIKVVSLGHRSGAVIMVRTDSAYKSFKDIRGKRVAVPSRFAVDYLF